ncbi:MAG: Abi family protein, partial [Mariprofundales bacterium]
AHYLSHLNYYRLAAYWLPFEQNHSTHQFKPNINFSQVLNMYVFDRELRLLVMDAVERVEVSLRTHFASHLSGKYGTHAHLQAELFFKQSTYNFTLKTLKKEVGRSGEDFIRHLTRKYDEELPPLWAVVELMSLGQLSTWYNNLKQRTDRKAIAEFYNVDEKHLRSFFHHLSIVRNLCAHHARLWNREFTFTYKLPTTRPQALINSLNRKAPRRLYNTLAMLAYLMDVTCTNHHWKQRLLELLKHHHIDAGAIGAPAGLELLTIWQKQ